MINSLKQLKESCDNEVNDLISKTYMKHTLKLDSAIALIKDGVIPDNGIVSSSGRNGFKGTFKELKDKCISSDLLENKIQYVIDLLYSNIPLDILNTGDVHVHLNIYKVFFRYDLLNIDEDEDIYVNIKKLGEDSGKDYYEELFTKYYEVSISIESSYGEFIIPILLDNNFILKEDDLTKLINKQIDFALKCRRKSNRIYSTSSPIKDKDSYSTYISPFNISVLGSPQKNNYSAEVLFRPYYDLEDDESLYCLICKDNVIDIDINTLISFFRNTLTYDFSYEFDIVKVDGDNYYLYSDQLIDFGLTNDKNKCIFKVNIKDIENKLKFGEIDFDKSHSTLSFYLKYNEYDYDDKDKNNNRDKQEYIHTDNSLCNEAQKLLRFIENDQSEISLSTLTDYDSFLRDLNKNFISIIKKQKEIMNHDYKKITMIFFIDYLSNDLIQLSYEDYIVDDYGMEELDYFDYSNLIIYDKVETPELFCNIDFTKKYTFPREEFFNLLREYGFDISEDCDSFYINSGDNYFAIEIDFSKDFDKHKQFIIEQKKGN